MRTRPRSFVPLLAVLSMSAAQQFDLPTVNTANFLPAIRAQIHEAEQLTKAHPRDPAVVGHLAMVLHAYQQYDAAARVYTLAHRLQPRNFGWLYLLGGVQKEQGEFAAAASSFRSALTIQPENSAARLRLAESLSALADWDNAAAAYQQILDKNPASPRAWYGLGRAQMAQGDHQRAVQSFSRACELFPQYGAAHFALAGELRRLGKPAEAQQQLAQYSAHVTVEPPLDDPLFERIHQLNRGSIAHLQRGAELERDGQYAEAIQEHETALASDPANVQAHINLISLYARNGDSVKAKQHFNAAVELNAGRADAWYNYGVLLSREKDISGAEKAYRRALEINPSYAEAHYNLGVIEEQQGSLDAAANDFRQAIADRPDDPLPRFHLGRILVNQERYADAIPQFLRCLEPDNDQAPACFYALAATYARSGDRPHALEYFERARSAAIAHGQSRLLSSIERDLQTLSNQR